jgi:integrase
VLKSRDVVNFARIERHDLPKLLQDIEVYPGNQLTRLAMKLMALTFLRTTEMLEAMWTEFDFINAPWDVQYLEPRAMMMRDWADFPEETLRTGKASLPRPKWMIYDPDSMPIPSVRQGRDDERRADHFAE